MQAGKKVIILPPTIITYGPHSRREMTISREFSDPVMVGKTEPSYSYADIA
jgi:hypothetical protein